MSLDRITKKFTNGLLLVIVLLMPSPVMGMLIALALMFYDC